jgi:hypothetical protein
MQNMSASNANIEQQVKMVGNDSMSLNQQNQSVVVLTP